MLIMFDTCNMSLIFIIFLIFMNFFLQIKRRRLNEKNLPPSPPSLPILCHLHLLKTPLHRTFHSLSQKHGPIFSLRLGSNFVVVVSSPSAVQECFTKNDFLLGNRPHTIIGEHLNYNHTTIITAPYGDHWRNLRRIAAIEIFSSARLNAFASTRKDQVKQLLRKLSQNTHDDFAKVELKSLLSGLAYNITMTMVAGKRYCRDDGVADEEEARQFIEIMEQAVAYTALPKPGDVFHWINIFSGGYEKKVVKLAEKTDVFLQGLIDEQRIKRGGNSNTMIHHLVSLQEQQPEYFSDQIIKGFILILLLAGTDTSSVTLEWAMSNLLNHPHVLQKARVELDAQVGQECLVNEQDISKLPYLQSIISETLRLYPPAPLLVPHFSSGDCTIGGFEVPRGTTVLVNAWAMQRDHKLWDNPESFNPERFENDDDLSHKFIPFGLGRRACPGTGMAQRVVSLTLGSLIQCFDWERIDEVVVDMVEGNGLTMSKEVSLVARCKARSIMNKVLD